MTTRPTRPERPSALPGETPILDQANPRDYVHPIGQPTDPLPGVTPILFQPPAMMTVTMEPNIDPLINVAVGDGYVIASQLASGGMGALYVAQHHAAPNKKKAIKVILAEMMAKCSPRTREDIAHRFEVEARIALALDHPNVVNVDGWGQLPGGALYIKMELLKGKDLKKWARDRHDRRVPVDEVLQVFAQVCSALEQAHRLGVVHRDLKPQNIFMVEHPDGEIVTKLLDFGIARVTSPDALPGGKKTTIPRAMGTPGYWSPEQQNSPGDVDLRADIYALGVIAYELLTGHLPGFGSLAPHQLPPGFPIEWYEPIAKALSGDPAKRHSSARDLLAELIDATPDGAALALSACRTLYRTAASAADSTIKAPASIPGLTNTAPPPAAPPLPPSTLAQAAGYATQAAPRRGRIALAAIGGVVAGAVAIAVITQGGSSSTTAPSSTTTAPSSTTTAPSSTTTAPSSTTTTAPSSTTTAPNSTTDTAAVPAAAVAQDAGPSSTATPAATSTPDASSPPAATRNADDASAPKTPPRKPQGRTGVERL